MITRYFRYLKNRVMTKPKKSIISIVGTTGVGKSQFSIDLAKAVNGEIINADSMQVYRDLDNITNKHPVEEREGIPHHVMNHVNWDEEYFIHRFAQEAGDAIRDIHARGKVPIVIGGTHYYLQTLLFNNKTMAQSNEPKQHDKETTRESDTVEAGSNVTPEQLAILDGPVSELFEALSQIDPIIAQKFHPKDHRKLRRALEIYYSTGELPSKLYHEQKLEELEDSSLVYNTLLFWVYSDQEVLVPRLDARVDKMMAGGGIDEIQQMYGAYQAQEPRPDCTRGIWQVIGFKEFLPWLSSQQPQPQQFQDGVERMKIRTRQYAKYQVKWIKKLLGVELHKEKRFGYKYGGKMYVLDASDLETWQQNVAEVGISIGKQFLENGPTAVEQAQTPARLSHLVGGEIKSNKQIGAEAGWKHYKCEHCKDKTGMPFVAVGEESWQLHVGSRRHKRQVGAGAKKRKHEEMLQKYGKGVKREEKGEEAPAEKSEGGEVNGEKPAQKGE
ncbi:tRNA isopentenyltransferase [Suhomyces tanzawaensis NRRL Y-17324]|uniref:tRNA dimethylallyltransferase n=1 Tax=Suhomyces tanzawaensis NRRL Y-17324 TaxID=984487 RepID=A0A1E4SD63_9ASCO|nr:tRNA isopentenyltransferase [Suhomyces tanzawaensis NRRL Y-17324]ODV77445.1 tRNA isopentenyltransferase [Suhomyces tanzawaensis NRRL Y-17324]